MNNRLPTRSIHEKNNLTKTAMAQKMQTSRSALDRLLDPPNLSVTNLHATYNSTTPTAAHTRLGHAGMRKKLKDMMQVALVIKDSTVSAAGEPCNAC